MKRYIIGLGNYAMMDDSIGLRIVENIVDNGLDEGFEAVEIGNDGMKLLTYFEEDTEKIVIVDSAKMGKKAGEFVIFLPEEVETKKVVGNISTHEGDILKLIELGKQMSLPIPKLKILAIEPGSMEADMGLSEALEVNFSIYVETAIKEVRS